ncbi:MAG: hypothetical protein KF805_00390 [Phycisphaeraceae bacterium]|nr:hypothetical protein [Phycisphaeraceae bacterium]
MATASAKSSPATIHAFKAGTNVVCTVSAMPKATGAISTIERLMRRDPDNRRALGRAQTKRRQRMTIYNRGNRDWVSRETAARVVRVEKGAAWKMVYTLDLAPDIASVSRFIQIKAG